MSVDPSPVRVERTGRIAIAEPETAARLLFTPLGELSWAPGWDAEIVHPPHAADAVPPDGTVFRTRVGPRPRTWVLVRSGGEPWSVDYVNWADAHRVTEVRVLLRALGSHATEAEVRYRWTALSPAAADELGAESEASYAAMLNAWSDAIRERNR